MIQTTLLPLDKLEQNTGQIEGLPRNPRTWTLSEINRIAASLKETPELFEARPILVLPKNGKYVIIGGNLRYEGCRKNKDKEVPCFVLPEDTPLEKLKELVIKDNGSFGAWDYDALANEWDNGRLPDWGVPVWEMEQEDKQEEERKEVKEDDFNEEKDGILVRCKPGDIWQLGDHRLMCGDSTDLETVKTLMGGVRADMSFTSPPYNAGRTPTEAAQGIDSKYAHDTDDKSDVYYLNLLLASTRNALSVAEYAFVNVQSISGNKTQLIDYMAAMKRNFADTIIWDKEASQPAMASNVLNSEFEYVHIFSERATRAIGVKPFRGTLSNVLHLSNRKGRDREIQKMHHATFPIDFAAYFIENFTNDSVLDLFGGSGTTLIAAEQLGRKAYLMELDPYYCDVIIARWEKLTGKQAQKIN